MASTKAPQKKSASARLLELVGELVTERLDTSGTITPRDIAAEMRTQNARLVDEVARANGDKLLRSMARSTLKRRADAPLQEQLDLGLPDDWTLRVRDAAGTVHYVLARQASEDDLLGAEEDRRHALKRAQARAANGAASGQRALERAKANLERIGELLQRLSQDSAAS